MEQELLFAALGELTNRIEKCGASPELTHAVTLCSDLRMAIGNKWNPADRFAEQRVLDALKKGGA
jgi:rRNA maturation protein Nop10